MEKPESVILVNEEDQETGIMEKMEAHRLGFLHRAFSIFIFNDKGEMLLQRRPFSKYHSGGLWTNTCCSHPRPGESTSDAANRRLQEEMGFTVPLNEVFSFTYKASFSNGLTEHEFDHVFFGKYSGNPIPNPEEVSDWKYVDVQTLEDQMRIYPEEFTEWFKIAFPLVLKAMY